MWEFICEVLPVLAFLTGTLLGALIMSLFNREQRRHLETQYQNTSNSNVALESQLIAKSRLESDLARTNTELEKLRREINAAKLQTEKPDNSLRLENEQLRAELKKVSTLPLKPKKKQYNDYQQFLIDLEDSIKKAKQKSFATPPKKKKVTSKKGKKKKSKGKYDLYKEKYSGKTFSASNFLHQEKVKSSKKGRDLTYLYGITDDIQEILNKHGIKTFTDLALTKIAELKAILALEGDVYAKTDPLNWPIQARIAEKGQWEILDEYKAKMA